MRFAVAGLWTSAVMPARLHRNRLLLSPVCVDSSHHRQTSMNQSCRRAMNQPQQSTAQSIGQHPVVVIGAGPIGLAAAANAAERGIDFVVLEAGQVAGATVGRVGARPPVLVMVRARRPGRAAAARAGRRLDRPGRGRLPHRRRVARARTCSHWPTCSTPAQAGSDTAHGSPESPAQGRDAIVDSGRESDPFTVHVDDAPPARSDWSPARSSTPPAPGRHRTRSVPTATPRPANAPTPDGSSTASRTSATRPCAPGTPASTSPSPARAPRPKAC